jgi:hypothetical protein
MTDIIIDVAGEPAGVAGVAREFVFTKIDPAGPLVTLSLDDITGITTFDWSILAQPPNSTATLSTPTLSSTTFTPNALIPGTYLVQCIFNGGTSVARNAVAWKTRYLDLRIPAPGESLEFGTDRGWDPALHKVIEVVDDATKENRQRAVINYVTSTSAPPTEVSGDRYILDNSGAPHANWDGASQLDIVEFDGATWIAHSPIEGWVTYVDTLNQDALYIDDGVPAWEFRPSVTSHISATAAHGATGEVVGTTNTQNLSNKTLITPTIADLTNATHDHSNAANGGAFTDLPVDSIAFTPAASHAHQEGLLFYSTAYRSLTYFNDITNSSLQVGHEIWKRVKNNTGSIISNGSICYINGEDSGISTIALAQSNSSTTCFGTIGIATHDIGIGQEGLITVIGTVRDVNTNGTAAGTPIYLSPSSAGDWTSTVPQSPNYIIRLGVIGIEDAVNGTLETNIDIGSNVTGTIKIFNGAILEDHTVDVTSDGATVTLSLEQAGGGNLNLFFNGTLYPFTSPPATVALTAGSDTSPTLNYVYIPESTQVLTVSTTGFPAAQHVPVATVLVQSAASVATDDVYKLHAWTDHLTDANDQGHVSHLNERLRILNADWKSGTALTPTITPGSPDNIDIATSSGEIYQLHKHSFPAFDTSTGSYLQVINDSVTPYKKITDLNGELTDSQGVSMTGRGFSFVIWGVANQTTVTSKLFLNLPSGSYSSGSLAKSDASKYSNYNVPSDYRGVGFLIARLTFSHSSSGGGTWTLVDNEDLRGQYPSVFAGGGSAQTTIFPDNTFRVYDDGDVTKSLAFQCSGITTATTRTITVPDKDVTVDDEDDPRPLRNNNFTTVNASTYTVLSTDRILWVTYNGTCTITIPSALIATASWEIWIKDARYNAAVYPIDIETAGSETIEDQTSAQIDVNGGVMHLATDTSNLFDLSRR